MIPKGKIYDELEQVYDPELGINVVDLGLVYRVDAKDNTIEVDFTLTFPGCPVGEIIENAIQARLKKAFQLREVKTNLVWSPRWNEGFMSEEARLTMGYPV